MGIPSYRFVEKSPHDYICAICFEVVLDPVMANSYCWHKFCHKCVGTHGFDHCPVCQKPLEEPKFLSLNKEQKLEYRALKVKCLNQSCEEPLDIATYLDHDENVQSLSNFVLIAVSRIVVDQVVSILLLNNTNWIS